MKTKQAVPRSPIKLIPVPVDRVWGGQAVSKQFGWTPPPDRTIGEWWTLSFRHDYPSIIDDGFFAGIPLPQLLYAHPELLGLDVEPALLIKILDSADRLSVQVHPDDALAQEMGLDSGKTECWYYLESEPGAKIYCGLAEGVDLDAFLDQASKSPQPSAMEALLKAVPVKEGALSFIPAGTVHAIGQGVLLLEVQQNSDTTFRIYDWGRPREVHIDQARRAMQAAQDAGDEPQENPDQDRLVHCEKFDLRRISADKTGAFPPTGPVYASVTCLAGKGRILAHEYENSFQPGDTWFLPADCPAVSLESTGKTCWIHSQQPHNKR